MGPQSLEKEAKTMHLLEVLWIPIFRFRLLQRLWATALISVNAAALIFIQSTHAQVVILAGVSGGVAMMTIYANHGFVRLLGIGHVFWIPMLPFLVFNLPDETANPDLYHWVVLLISFNSISLIIDAIDLVRYWRGERQPYYRW